MKLILIPIFFIAGCLSGSSTSISSLDNLETPISSWNCDKPIPCKSTVETKYMCRAIVDNQAIAGWGKNRCQALEQVKGKLCNQKTSLDDIENVSCILSYLI